MWEIAFKYLIPFTVAAITGAGSLILHKRKVRMMAKDRDDLILEKKVIRQMGVVKGILNILWKDMKKDYADLVMQEYNIDIISDKKCDERKSFFIATFETKIPLMDKYEIEFRRNGIEQWEDHDITARVNRILAFVLEEFEKNFNPNKDELVTKVMRAFKDREEKFKRLFTDLYNSARHVYDEEDQR